MNDQYKESDQLIRKFNISQQRLTRNRLILVSVLNLICFVVMLVALVYYRYALITIKFLKQQLSPKGQHIKQFWFNVLYIKDNNGRESFASAADTICQGNVQCEQKIDQIALTGYCCFIFFVIGMALQLYDFYRVFLHLSMCKIQADLRDNFRRMLTVLAYASGIIISIIGLQFAGIDFELGISFWVALIAAFLFIGLLTYEHISVKIMMKQSLILELIENQRIYTKSTTFLQRSDKTETPAGLIKQCINHTRTDNQLKKVERAVKVTAERNEDEPSYTL